MTSHTDWTARRILQELCDPARRREILTSFWKSGEPHARAAAVVPLARALHFRDETVRKAPPEKKADWLASRLHSPEFDEFFEMALMTYHTTRARPMLGAFLDAWSIPHNEGSIEIEEYRVPSEQEVQKAVDDLREKYPREDITLYLAAAGLLMGAEWRRATWPAVSRLRDSSQ